MPTSGRHRLSARRRTVVAAAAIVAAASVATSALVHQSATAAVAYTSQTLHFQVAVGPDRTQTCDIVGILFTPSTATRSTPAPAILTTNGFGGSDLDQVPFAEREAALGYVVLTYSGLGFGGSGCKITLDDPDYDGVAASQLVSYLGGAPGIAFLDASHTTPAPVLDVVKHDGRDHAGGRSPYDPRVGMWGGSYGGQIQFAAASVDPRIDMLNPQITWNDLSYSLGPNNAGTPNPGAVKINWGLGFSGEGMLDGVQGTPDDPYRNVGCPNFADFVCPALLTAGSTGYFEPGDVAQLRHASVSSYLSRIRIPVLLDQGEVDTLFNLNEAIVTYRALKAQETPVAMMWREQGHSGGTPTAAGRAYENGRIQNWFDHYLKGADVSTGVPFAYYRDWTGTFAEAAGYPATTTSRAYYLSGANTLVTSTDQIGSGDTQAFTTPPAGTPTSTSDLDALGSAVPAAGDLPDSNTPGTYGQWLSAPLAQALDVVGSPTLDVRISAPSAEATSLLGPGGQLVLFAKVYDVAPDGTAGLINGLVAPVRIADPSAPVHITLPAVAHEFAAGHRVQLVLAGGDVNYRGGLPSTAVAVTSGSQGQVLRLPALG